MSSMSIDSAPKSALSRAAGVTSSSSTLNASTSRVRTLARISSFVIVGILQSGRAEESLADGRAEAQAPVHGDHLPRDV